MIDLEKRYLKLPGVTSDLLKLRAKDLEPDSKIVTSIAHKLSRFIRNIPKGGEFILWEYDEPYDFEQLDQHGKERFGMELACGELFVNRISLFNDIDYHPSSYAIVILGTTNVKNELFNASWGVELQVVFILQDGQLKLDEIVNLGQEGHRLKGVEFQISNSSKLLALSIANRSLELFSNVCTI